MENIEIINEAVETMDDVVEVKGGSGIGTGVAMLIGAGVTFAIGAGVKLVKKGIAAAKAKKAANEAEAVADMETVFEDVE